MAGTIVSDTLQDGSGNSTATTNAIKGSAKAWVNFNGQVSPYTTIAKSYNVGSITYISQGLYGINITSGAVTDANYAVTACGRGAGAQGTYYPTTVAISYATAPTLTVLTIETRYSDTYYYNFCSIISVAIFD